MMSYCLLALYGYISPPSLRCLEADLFQLVIASSGYCSMIVMERRNLVVSLSPYLLRLLMTMMTLFTVVIFAFDYSEPSFKNELNSWHFLENYGYLPKSVDNEHNLLSSTELTKAIKLMQKYANIPQTGELDARTLIQMRAPRCALPDVKIDDMPRKRRYKRFELYGPKWTKMPIKWSITKPSQKVPFEIARETFWRAFNLWATASPKVRFEETIEDVDIRIGFYTGKHGCGSRQAFDGPGTKLAHAFAPPNGDVHFDDDEEWMNETSGLSLYWTALHEFGHSLGFAHTADKSSIMFPYYQDHGDSFVLPSVDKARILFLYRDLDTKQDEEKLPFPNRTPYTSTTPSNRGEYDPHADPTCSLAIDAIASIRGDIFIFKQNAFWWLKSPSLELVRKEAIPIADYFDGFPRDIKRVDAVYERKSDQKIMFFVGKQFWLFSANRFYDGPRSITELGLPINLEKIDTITNWGHNGRAYIFAGPIYWRLNEAEREVEVDYPRDMTVWKNVPPNVDAAFTWEFDSSTYFFKRDKFWLFDNRYMQTSDEYPKSIKDFWFRSAPLRCDPANNQPSILELRSRTERHFHPSNTASLAIICLSLSAIFPNL